MSMKRKREKEENQKYTISHIDRIALDLTVCIERRNLFIISMNGAQNDQGDLGMCTCTFSDVCECVCFGHTWVNTISNVSGHFQTFSVFGRFSSLVRTVRFGSVVRSRCMSRSRARIDRWRPCN